MIAMILLSGFISLLPASLSAFDPTYLNLLPTSLLQLQSRERIRKPLA